MLSSTQAAQVLIATALSMTGLFVIYLLAPFIIDHIQWFAGASILVAAGGEYALSRTTA
jgi:hypothetical protein